MKTRVLTAWPGARGKKRLLHALGTTVVDHNANGTHVQFFEWLGRRAHQFEQRYHPGTERGFAASAEALGFSVLRDMGFDTLPRGLDGVAIK